jgi:hypothetical protein
MLIWTAVLTGSDRVSGKKKKTGEKRRRVGGDGKNDHYEAFCSQAGGQRFCSCVPAALR